MIPDRELPICLALQARHRSLFVLLLVLIAYYILPALIIILLKVVATAVDFVKFVKTKTGGEDLIPQFMGEKQGEHK